MKERVERTEKMKMRKKMRKGGKEAAFYTKRIPLLPTLAFCCKCPVFSFISFCLCV